MNYDFSQWVDILVVYGSIVIGVSYSVVVFLVVSGV